MGTGSERNERRKKRRKQQKDRSESTKRKLEQLIRDGFRTR